MRYLKLLLIPIGLVSIILAFFLGTIVYIFLQIGKRDCIVNKKSVS